ncbi:hypothetical protein [uncultured Bacteroides sp.]|uniref:hypothetical protein n=1 Tax=uncultured Bacteroides sp. TaxID=162156 RepID=UPI00280BDDF8|nr:hypothetical protein [uncultured Bacteroides sp.]
MNKTKHIYCWLIVSLLCSMTAICLSLFRIQPFSVSESAYIGIIVTLMGIIFTIFVGYQIYNIIDIKKELENFSLQKEQLKESVTKLSEYQTINEAYNFNNRGMLAVSMSKYYSAICLLLKSLESLLSSSLLGNHWADVDNLKNNIQYCFLKRQEFETPENDELYKLIINIMNYPKYNNLPDDLKQLLTEIKKNNSTLIHK